MYEATKMYLSSYYLSTCGKGTKENAVKSKKKGNLHKTDTNAIDMKPSTSSLVMQPNIVYPEIQHTMVPLNISEHVNNLEPRSLTPSRHDILANAMTINDIPYDDNLPDILEFLNLGRNMDPPIRPQYLKLNVHRGHLLSEILNVLT